MLGHDAGCVPHQGYWCTGSTYVARWPTKRTLHIPTEGSGSIWLQSRRCNNQQSQLPLFTAKDFRWSPAIRFIVSEPGVLGFK